MTEKEHQFLESRGYRKCNQTGPCFPYADFFYQNCFRDEKGKKYYVYLIHYDNTKYGDTESWMCHLNINNPHMTFEQHHVKLEDLDKLEEKCELFFKTMGCEYYELFQQKD